MSRSTGTSATAGARASRGSASRSHRYGWEAEKLIDEARANVAALINANPKEIVWTSGATESDNLAIKGAAHFYQKKGKHIITVKTDTRRCWIPAASWSVKASR